MLREVTDFLNGFAVLNLILYCMWQLRPYFTVLHLDFISYNKVKSSFSSPHKIHTFSWLSPVKTWGGWGVLLFGCTFAKTYFVISSKLFHNSISRQAWTHQCEFMSNFLKDCQFYSTKKCRELYFRFTWICVHPTCLLTVTYVKESFRPFVIDEISLESSRL